MQDRLVNALQGGKTVNMYAWREALSRIREVIDSIPGVEYRTEPEYARLNAALAAIRAGIQQSAL